MGAWFNTIGDPRYGRILRAYRRCGILKGAYAGIRTALCPLKDIEAALPPKGTFVDVGCGAGLLLQWLALGKNSGGLRLVGMEIDSRRVDLGSEVCKKLDIADRVDLRVGRFDKGMAMEGAEAVIFADVLHHMDYNLQKSMIAYAFESLSEGGIILIKDVGSRPFLKYCYNYLFDSLTHITRITKGNVGYYRSELGWAALLREQGLNTVSVKVKHLDFAPHVILIGRKETLVGE